MTAAEQPEVLSVIARVARENGVLLKVVTPDNRAWSSAFRRLPRADRLKAELQTPLPGEHQRLNAALALATVEVLQPQIPVTAAQIRDGLASVNWPGRLQLIERGAQKILLPKM